MDDYEEEVEDSTVQWEEPQYSDDGDEWHPLPATNNREQQSIRAFHWI